MAELERRFSSEKDVKVVVIDDSDFTRRSIIEVLEAHGFSVVGEADSAQKGMAVAMNTPCDIFLIDIVMPEASGMELAKHINEKLKNIAIIMMSSLNYENMIIESISSGALDYIQKPFDPGQLVKSVRKVANMLEEAGT